MNRLARQVLARVAIGAVCTAVLIALLYPMTAMGLELLVQVVVGGGLFWWMVARLGQILDRWF